MGAGEISALVSLSTTWLEDFIFILVHTEEVDGACFLYKTTFHQTNLSGT